MLNTIKNQLEKLTHIKNTILWKTNKGNFNSNSEDVIKINERNCYATIDPKLKSQLDPAVYYMFVNVLKKYETTKDDVAGKIKYIFNRLIILEINNLDVSLYTHKIYTNNGNELIIFDEIGNKALTKANFEYTIEYIFVNSYEESVLITGDSNRV